MKTCTGITQNVKLEDHSPRARVSGIMGECELCGATQVSTRTTIRGRSSIEACNQCMEKMGLSAPEPSPMKSKSTHQRVGVHKSRTSSTKRGKGHDIMNRRTEELRDDFASTIRQAREEKGWDQRELAKRMAERVNIIQHTEGGKRPTDSVVTKFERILDIKLMVMREMEEESHIRRSSDRPMTMADLYEQAKKDLRGD